MGQKQIYSILKQVTKFSRYLFTFIELIGNGSVAKIWKVQFLGTPRYFALKEMIKSKLIMNNLVSNAINEKEILSTLYHPFITNMYCSFHDVDYVYLLLEHFPCGDLRYQMNNHQKKFNEEQIRFYAGCALSSLEYLYNNNIIHLDIKPENFICDDKGYFHLSDFGNARKTKADDPKIKLNEVIGTPHYISPEMIIGDNVSYVSDYFCLGIILYELITGTTPIKGTYSIEMKNEVDKLNINLSPKECGYSFELCDLVNKLLKKNSNERIGNDKGVVEIKQHEFFKGFKWKQLFYRTLKAPFVPKVYVNNIKHSNDFHKKELARQNERLLNYLMKRKNENDERYLESLFTNYQCVHSIQPKMFTRFYNEELMQENAIKTLRRLSLYSNGIRRCLFKRTNNSVILTKPSIDNNSNSISISNNSRYNRDSFELRKSISMPKIVLPSSLSGYNSPTKRNANHKLHKSLINGNINNNSNHSYIKQRQSCMNAFHLSKKGNTIHKHNNDDDSNNNNDNNNKVIIHRNEGRLKGMQMSIDEKRNYNSNNVYDSIIITKTPIVRSHKYKLFKNNKG